MRRITACVSFCLLALAATVTVLAGPASAAVPGLQVVSRTSAFNSDSPKSIEAPCPPGKNSIGAGAAINNGRGDVVIDDLLPTGTFVAAAAYEHGNSPRNWSLTAYAVCANPLPGLQVVSRTSASNSIDKGISAPCPVGKRVVGAGAVITGGRGDVEVDDLIPTTTGVGATGFEIHGSTRIWSITAYAVCANPLPGLQIVSRTSASSSFAKSINARCPDGKALVGTGAELAGGLGDVVIEVLAMSTTSVTATGFENGNSPREWFVRAYAICATR